MSGATQDEIDEWTRAIDSLHGITVDDSDHRTVTEAIANLWSGFGYQDAPPEVTDMLVRALQAGYGTALRDLRDGKLDDEIREWRSDL